MKEKKISKEIGKHNSTIISLYLNYIEEKIAEIITLDEDGIIKINKLDDTVLEINLSK